MTQNALSLALLLVIPLVEYLVMKDNLLQHKTLGYLSLKDLAAGFTIIVRKCLDFYARSSRDSLHSVLHADWQEALTVLDESSLSGPTVAPARGHSSVKILFVNADSGSRKDQLLDFFGLTAEAADCSIYNPHSESCASRLEGVREVTDNVDHAAAIAETSDMIVIINALYFEREIEDAQKIVNSAKSGSLVAVRGFADHSFIATIAYQLAQNPKHARLIHTWNSHHIDDLFRGCRFPVYVLEDTDAGHNEPMLWHEAPSAKLIDGHHTETPEVVPYPPIGVIRQALENNAFNRFVVSNYLLQAIPEESADAVQEQMRALAHAGAGRTDYTNSLNMDDYVYLFRIGSHTESRAPMVFSDARSYAELQESHPGFGS